MLINPKINSILKKMLSIFCEHAYDEFTKDDLANVENFAASKVQFCKKCNRKRIVVVPHDCRWKTVTTQASKQVSKCMRCGRIYLEGEIDECNFRID